MLSQAKLMEEIREMLFAFTPEIEEKKMFGGLCFMVKDKMCVVMSKSRLMFRLDPINAEKYAEAGECVPMTHGGRKMSGFVYVDYEMIDSKKKLKLWIDRALDYNEHAKASKKK